METIHAKTLRYTFLSATVHFFSPIVPTVAYKAYWVYSINCVFMRSFIEMSHVDESYQDRTNIVALSNFTYQSAYIFSPDNQYFSSVKILRDISAMTLPKYSLPCTKCDF